jgi:RHS repeat-associated protein
MAPVTQGNVDKFGTYHRDQTTGLDYADQRYFGALSGRFLTADPIGSGLNHYGYVDGDPVNFTDPTGLITCGDIGSGFGTSTVRQFMTGRGDASLLADIMWHEGGPWGPNDNWNTVRYEQLTIGSAVSNLVAMARGDLVGYGDDGKAYSYNKGNTVGQVVLNIGGDNEPTWGIFSNGQLSGAALGRLNDALNVELGDIGATSINDVIDANTILLRSPECANVLSAIWATTQIASGVRTIMPGGGLPLFWNSALTNTSETKPSERGFNEELINLGQTPKKTNNYFFGLWAYPFGPVPPAGRGADVGIPRPGRGGPAR